MRPVAKLRVALYPHLSLLDDMSAHEEVWRRAVRACRRSLFLWMSMIVLALLSSPLLYLTAVHEPGRFPHWLRPLMKVDIALCILWIALAVAYPYIARTRMRACILRAMAELGVPVCPQCGYDLRGSTESRCPECGAGAQPQ